MRKFAIRIAVAGMAAGVALMPVLASPAVADASLDNINGGCSFDTNQLAGSNTNSGVMMIASATFNANTPIGATVTCAIAINGVVDPDTMLTASGFGVQFGVTEIAFSDDGGTLPAALCQRVQYADGYDTGLVCQGPAFSPWLPPEGNPLLLFDVVNGYLALHVDPVVCPVLAAHPGDYGPIAIKSDGDVYPNVFGYSGAPLYDCPPYNDF